MTSKMCDTCGRALPPNALRCPGCGTLHPGTVDDELADLVDGLERALGPGYRVLELIGRGGFAGVFRVHDERLDRDLAAKALLPDFAAIPAVAVRFRREAQTAARLNHPGIVPIYFVGAEGEIPCFAMPIIEGEPLSARIRREGPLPVVVAISIARDVAAALDFAHDKGVVHRDVKPDNILMEFASGRSMLADFGIAKALEAHPDVTGTGIALGTPQYMAPEQIEGSRSIDARADIYSLGVVVFEMLAGVTPFRAAGARAVFAQHYLAPVPSVVERRPELSDRLDDVLRRAMAKEPTERFANAPEFVRAVELAVGEKSVRRSTATTLPIERVDASQFTQLARASDPIEAFGTASNLLALSHAARELETFTVEAAARSDGDIMVSALQAATSRVSDPHVGLRQLVRELVERLGSNQAIAGALAQRWRGASTQEQAVVEGLLASLLPGIGEPLLDVVQHESAPELFLLADRVGLLSDAVAEDAATNRNQAVARAFALAMRESQRSPSSVEKWLFVAAKHAHAQVRIAVQETARARGGGLAERVGRQALDDPDVAVRQAAMRTLAASRRREAATELGRVLEAGAREDQLAAAEALGALGLAESLPHLLRVLERKTLFRKERGPLQIATVRAIAQLPKEISASILAALAEDGDPAIREIAGHARS